MDELTRALLPVVADPDQVAQLYGHLRAFCHDIRNDLALFRMQIYMARHNPAAGATVPLDAVEARYHELERFIDLVQTICRPMHPMLMPASLGLILDERRQDWVELFASRGRALRWAPPDREVELELDPSLLGGAIDAFASWRARVGPPAADVRVRWHAERRHLRLTWDEPPGPADVAEQGTPCDRLPCLALVLLGRVLAAHGGALAIDEGDGFRMEVRLPQPGVEWDGTGGGTARRKATDPARQANPTPAVRGPRHTQAPSPAWSPGIGGASHGRI